MRIGVNTGEALVALGARPELGEAMVAGDVMNTGARLQSAAPPGDPRRRAHPAPHGRTIEYDEAEPVTAKGKAEPLAAWIAIAPRARFGVDVFQSRGPLVGRERELDLVADALSRARAERTPQLVTLVGVPGIGKSRLVYELWRDRGRRPSSPSGDRGGRCPTGRAWPSGRSERSSRRRRASSRRTDRRGRGEAGGASAISSRRARPSGSSGISAARRARGRQDPGRLNERRRSPRGGASSRRSPRAARRAHLRRPPLGGRRPPRLRRPPHRPARGRADPRRRALRGRNCSSAGPVGVAESATRSACRSRLSQMDEPHACSRSCSNAACSQPRSRPTAPAGGRQPALRRGVRAHAAETGAGAAVPATLQGVVAARIDALSDDEKTLLQQASVLGKVFWTDALAGLAVTDARDLDDRAAPARAQGVRSA